MPSTCKYSCSTLAARCRSRTAQSASSFIAVVWICRGVHGAKTRPPRHRPPSPLRLVTTRSSYPCSRHCQAELVGWLPAPSGSLSPSAPLARGVPRVGRGSGAPSAPHARRVRREPAAAVQAASCCCRGGDAHVLSRPSERAGDEERVGERRWCVTSARRGWAPPRQAACLPACLPPPAPRTGRCEVQEALLRLALLPQVEQTARVGVRALRRLHMSWRRQVHCSKGSWWRKSRSRTRQAHWTSWLC